MGKIVCLFFLLYTSTAFTQKQRIIAEATITFSISIVKTNATPEMVNSINLSEKTLYIKGLQSRTDMVSPNFQQSILHNTKDSTTTILTIFGDNRFRTNIGAKKWKSMNSQYEGMSVQLIDSTKKILDYDCKKAVVTLKSGATTTMWYAPSIYPSIGENQYQFGSIPGFVLSYESRDEQLKSTIKFTASGINFKPVPTAKFDVPTIGYRLLN